MTTDQLIGVAGVGATVIFGIIGAFGLKKWNSRSKIQQQSVSARGIGIQSGRDTKIK